MSHFNACHIVVMGVSGCGKSTVGAALAGLVGLDYIDGDDLHPAANVEKMRSGIPLDDADRLPWLERCGSTLRDADRGVILGCSALKLAYRDILRRTSHPAQPVFVYLSGSRDLLLSRMEGRSGHYMPSSLLDSQLATLEPPTPSERAVTVDIDRPAAALAQEIFAKLGGWAERVAQP